ncbi:hypothetical protein GCM10007875_23560 [Limnobacter litoralis]|uniref:Cytochrome b5 heme-binding domain-containing protein n=2 Tax=Limnobacter litoralis TaxID=481366 RepID=A0ABQ5YTZ6_9BURK|nr:hypothetical protein GCM10007875_23560 [Limnobacter litoralis]
MKLFKWFFIILISIPIVLAIFFYARNKAIGPTGWAKDNTEEALRGKMKDPNSMTIRSSFVIQKTTPDGDNEIFVCGIVDGKNSFGAYTGGSRFASRSVASKLGTFDTYDVEMEDVSNTEEAHKVNMLSPFESVYWNSYCVDSKHPPIHIEG